MKRQRTLVATLALAALGSAQAATINIVNGDGASEGFNDPTVVAVEGGNTGTTRGAQRLILFQRAAEIWGGQLASNQAIKVLARFDPLFCATGSAVLGSAGPGTFGTLPSALPNYFTNTWYAIAELESVRNLNLNSTDAEIDATFNSAVDSNCMGGGTRFWYGIDPAVPVPANRIALLPTLLHELAHGLGFLTLVCTQTTGCGGNGGFGAPAQGTPDIWMHYLKSSSSNKLWLNMSDAERQASITGDPNLVWDGPLVTAAIPTFLPGGAGVQSGRVRMYAPNPVEPGSSVSHFSTAASPNLLMEPAINSNLFDQVDLTLPLLRDIGWPTTAAPANQAPNISAPATINGSEDSPSSLNGISFTDPDAGSGSLNVNLSVPVGSGTLSASPSGGVSIVSGNGSNSLLVSGSLASLNAWFGAAASNPDYTPVANASGNVTLTININDNGNTGSGGALAASRNLTLAISAVNDAPINGLPANINITEDTAGALSGFSVTDVDAGASTMTISFSLPAGGGSLTAANAGGVSGSGSGTTSLSLSGSLSNLNSYLASAASRPQYTPASNNTDPITLTITSNDGGASGSGGAKTDTDSRSINFAAVNDAPNVSAPSSLVMQIVGSTAISGIVLSDIDAASGNLDAVLSVDQGVLLATNNDGVTVVSGNNSTLLNLFGPLSNLNTFFNNGRVSFNPLGNTSTSTLTITCDDNGHTGAGTSLACASPANISLLPVLFANGFE